MKERVLSSQTVREIFETNRVLQLDAYKHSCPF